jgi:hypothetical protein
MTGSNTHGDENEADIFGVKDLGGAGQVDEQVSKRGLQQEERRAIMTEDLCAPSPANEIIVLQDAAMRLEFSARFQRDDEMFVTQTDELGKVAVTCYCGVKFE